MDQNQENPYTPGQEPAGPAPYQAPEQENGGPATYQAPEQENGGPATYQAPEQEPAGPAAYQAPQQESAGQAYYQAPQQESAGSVSLQKPDAQQSSQSAGQTQYQTIGQSYQTPYQTPYSSMNTFPVEDNSPGGLAVASLVTGILSILCCCIGVGALFGIAAIILGCVSLSQRKGKGLAIAGIITGAFGLIFSIGMIIYYVAIYRVIQSDPTYNQMFWEEFYDNYDGYYNFKMKLF